MKTAIEVYKLLPKTNCGQCGTPTCFGFAAKMAASLSSPDDCPSITPATKEALREGGKERKGSPGTVYQQALESLAPKIQALDFQRAAPLFGATLLNPEELEITFLNGTYRVRKDRITEWSPLRQEPEAPFNNATSRGLRANPRPEPGDCESRDSSGQEPLPWISILIYNHLCMPDPPGPSGEWISFSSLPAAHAKDKAWAGHVEQEISKHFSGKVETLEDACVKLGGKKAIVPGNYDAAFEFRFFPQYPVLLLFHDAIAEENFPAQCTLLLDRNVHCYLDIESIVVLGEEFTNRLKQFGEIKK